MEQDDYATLLAAEAGGARIQAYRVDGWNGDIPLHLCPTSAQWVTLEEPAQWTCHPSRYRVEQQA